MPPIRVDRKQFEQAYDEMIDRQEQREGDVLTVTGNHEDHGRVRLRREAGVFTVKAESLEFVRPWGVKEEQPADD